jgi:hypothetical protein
MHDFTAQRTLVKSPPELWSELSEVDRLARHLEAFGEIKITKLEPEQTVAWEGEGASGTVSIEPSGWGTKVTLTAHVEEADEPAPDPEPEQLKPEGVPDETSHIGTERHEPPEAQALVEEETPAENGDVPRKRSFMARLFGRERKPRSAEGPVWVTGAPDLAERPPLVAEEPSARPEPEPPEPAPTPAPPPTPATQLVLESALEALGSAHHRPFSRG